MILTDEESNYLKILLGYEVDHYSSEVTRLTTELTWGYKKETIKVMKEMIKENKQNVKVAQKIIEKLRGK